MRGSTLQSSSLPPPEITGPPLFPDVANSQTFAAVIDRTALYAARSADPLQFEERVREGQLSDPKFSFLDPADHYHAYYRHRVDEAAKGELDEDSGSSLRSSSGLILPPPFTKALIDRTAFYAARSADPPQYEERVREGQRSDPRFSFLNPADPYHAYYRHRMDNAARGGDSTQKGVAGKHTKKEEPVDYDVTGVLQTNGTGSANITTGGSASSSSLRFGSGLILPPLDTKAVIDRTVLYVARSANPLQYEERLREGQRNDLKFSFLNLGDPYNVYYRHRLDKVIRGEVGED